MSKDITTNKKSYINLPKM